MLFFSASFLEKKYKMEKKSNQFISYCLTWGAFCGVMLVVYMFFTNYVITGGEGLQTAGIMQYMILSLGVYFCQKNLAVRFLRNGLEFNFSILFWAGLICGASASLFTDLYSAIYVKIINPDFMSQSVEQAQKILAEKGSYSKDNIDMAASVSEKIFLPLLMVFNTVFYSVLSAIFSAFGAFLLNLQNKKK